MSDNLKQQGNDALKQGNTYEAIKLYTEAINIDSDNYLLFSNRSNAYYQDKNFAFAFKDAQEVIKLNPQFEKGYIRAADALIALNKFSQAVKIINQGLLANQDSTVLKQKQQQFTPYIIPNLSSISLITNPHPFQANLPTIIECFATWCGPCKQMIPHLAQFQSKYVNKLNLISVSSEPIAKLQAFVKGNAEMNQYDVGCDQSQVVQNIMGLQGVQGIPHAFIYDKEGFQVWSGHPSQLDQVISSFI